MRLQLFTVVLVIMGISVASAQVASHAPTTAQAILSAQAPTAPGVQVGDKPVARVNGAALTDRDLLREMFAIFLTRGSTTVFPRGWNPKSARAPWK